MMIVICFIMRSLLHSNLSSVNGDIVCVCCRNISAGGSDEVVEAMVQQEVLGPLVELLDEYRESWSPATTDLGQEAPRDVDPVSNTFVHATHLLWNLWCVRRHHCTNENIY